MRALQLLLMTVTLGAFACGGDDNTQAKSPGCPELAGTWTITDHCDPDLKGTMVPITQDGCTVSTGGTFAGLSGPIGSSGQLDLKGTLAGTALSCKGQVDGDHITEDCSGCKATLTR